MVEVLDVVGIVPQEKMQKINSEIADVVKVSEALQVIDQSSADRVSQLMQQWKEIQNEIDETFDPIIRKAFQTHKDLVSLKRRFEEPFTRAIDTAKQKVAIWLREEEKKRREEERRIQEELRKKEEEKYLKQAQELTMQGFSDDEILENVPIPTAPPVVIEKPSVAGVSSRKNWTYRIENEALLPREYLCPDEKKIGAVVKAMKEKTNIPGVIAYATDTVVIAGKK